MFWLQRYRMRHYLRNAIWIYPVAAMAIAVIAVRLLHWFERAMGWETSLNPDTIRTVLSTLAGAMFTFIVFVCSSLLLVLQLASAQLTPRAIGTLFKDAVMKLTLCVFVFTFTFVLAALIRVEETVPLLITDVAALSCLASIGLFLYLPDGSLNIVYTNFLSEVILREQHRGAQSWLDYFQYNDGFEVTLHAHPSAVVGYSFDGSNELVANLRTSDGLIERTEYYTSTDLPAGAVHGHKSWEKLQQGTSGVLANVRFTKYTSHTVTGTNRTIYPVLSETVYRTETGGAITTSYDYDFDADDARIRRQTTLMPPVPLAQNGDGIAHSFDELYNELGQLTWSRDALGFITYRAYEVTTGALLQQIQDVDMSRMSGVPGNPGWSTPAGGGQHLITDFEVDVQGRATQELGPWHDSLGQAVRRATWTVYDDVQHIVYTAQGYATLTAGELGYAYTLVNPVTISKYDADGNLLEQITAVRATTVGRLFGCDAFAQSTYRKWTVNRYDAQGRLAATRVYRQIPVTGSGEAGVNYDESTFAYDIMGRLVRQRTPGGTITRTVYDPAGRAVAEYVGTNDANATTDDPTGGAPGIAAGNNLVATEEREYDGNLVGDGNLTLLRKWVNNASNRVTTFLYDWRDRLLDIDGEIDFFERRYYDNLNQLTKTERFDTAPSGNLIARQETKIDDWGRVYQVLTYAVIPGTGTVGNVLTDNTWFDALSQVLKQLPAGSRRFTKLTYDALGRSLRQYVGYDLDESVFSEAGSVADDTIFEQAESVYDPAGNLIATAKRQRFHNATGTGELQGPTGAQPQARVTYQANWFDPIGRRVSQSEYGTNAGLTFIRSAVPPVSTDAVLVTGLSYDEAGRLATQTDPRGVVTAFGYDAADRQMRMIQNSVDCPHGVQGDITSTISGEPPSEAMNIVVETYYNADGNVISVNAHNKVTGNQLTQYVYGTTLGDSDIASSLLKRAAIYPDAGDSTDRIMLAYNRQGELILTQDQNVTIHEYDYDLLGRQTQDRVTTLGNGVDGAIRRIESTYEVRGIRSKLTSYDNSDVGSGSVVNEVQFICNDFGQAAADYQSHMGSVDMTSTPKVQYDYANGSSNTIRPTSITYPDGRTIGYDYGLTNSSSDALSRVESVTDSLTAGTINGYQYLGLGSFVQEEYLETASRWTLINQAGTVDPSTGDIYSGLDRFGRVKDNRWLNTNSGADLDRLKYGYDRGGNCTWRENAVARADGFAFDEKYVYDLLNRLNRMDRGELKPSRAIVDKQFTQAWSLDATGNWRKFLEDASGDGDWTLDQTRTSNKVNEITGITTLEGPAWIAPTYNRAGNMTTMPQPGDPTEGYTATYDAWNRLVRIEEGSDKVAEYEYDGAKRRIMKRTYLSNVLNETRHFYYTEPSKWQVVEERVESSSNAERQFVWGLRYVDDLILRDRDTNSDGIYDERLYGMQDANWNVTSISDSSGSILERYNYDPYGTSIPLTPTFEYRGDSSFAWEVRYAGYRFDSESTLYCVRNRIYHPSLSWLQRDPFTVAYLGLLPDENLYIYAGANPLIRVDPLGLTPVHVVVGIVAGVVGCLAGIGVGLIPSANASAWNRVCRGTLGCLLGVAAGLGMVAAPQFAGCIAGLGYGLIQNVTNPLCDYLVDGVACNDTVMCLAAKTVFFGVVGCLVSALGPIAWIYRLLSVINTFIWKHVVDRICKF